MCFCEEAAALMQLFDVLELLSCVCFARLICHSCLLRLGKAAFLFLLLQASLKLLCGACMVGGRGVRNRNTGPALEELANSWENQICTEDDGNRQAAHAVMLESSLPIEGGWEASWKRHQKGICFLSLETCWGWWWKLATRRFGIHHALSARRKAFPQEQKLVLLNV